MTTKSNGRDSDVRARKSRSTESASSNRKSGNRSASGRNVSSRKSTSKYEQITTDDIKKKKEAEPNFRDELTLLLTILISVLLILSYFEIGGIVGKYICRAAFGLFGFLAYIVPFALFFAVAFCLANRSSNKRYIIKLIAMVGLLITISAVIQLTFGAKEVESNLLDYYKKSAENRKGGGLLGGLLCFYLVPAFGKAGSYMFFAALEIIWLMMFSGTAFFRSYGKAFKEFGKKIKAESEQSAIEDEEFIKNYDEEDLEFGPVVKKKKKDDKDDIDDRNVEAEEDREPSSEKIDSRADERRKVRKNNEIGERMESDESDSDEDEGIFFPKRRRKKVISDDQEKNFFGGVTTTTPVGVKKTFADDELDRKFGKGDFRIERSETCSEEVSSFEENDKINDRFAIYGRENSTSEDQEMYDDHEAEENNEAVFDGNEDQSQAYTNENIDNFDQNTYSEENVYAEENTFSEEKSYNVDQFDGVKKDYNSFTYEESEEQEEMSFSDAAFADMKNKEASSYTKGIFDEAPYGMKNQATEPYKTVPEKNTKTSYEEIVSAAVNAENMVVEKEYVFPPIDLLTKPVSSTYGDSDDILQQTALKLQSTLESFGVRVTVTNVSCGPAVTRYELQPEQGVKVSKITSLADDIKLNLAAADIRIEAPIPGKAAVGIEVPNKENTPVFLREIISSKEFKEHKSNVAFTVGKDIGGQNVVGDIAKMPHLLIAGATGSGKSVCINTIIMSILYKADPRDVKFIMIDPKVVELSVYNGIPHLLIPVVTDPKKASAALNWAVSEMTDRYKKFAEMQVRDFKGYNERIKEIKNNDPSFDRKPMYQMVVIVDELADLMMVAPGDVEDAICRLAQMARAAGIHLILATQRPSVNVITGLIKANVPSRIAFAVSSGIDSRTILDGVGAEKLLGKGDMLYFPSGYPKPVRIQGAFVSDKEVSAVVDFLKEENAEISAYNQEISKRIASGDGETGGGSNGGNDRDDYFEEAGRFIIEKDKASIGMLQRAYKIGFNRAARIMDQLAKEGVVGPEEGTKPRKILMTMDEFEAMIYGE